VTLVNASSQPLVEVVGGNCQRIRTIIGITQDELARHARDVGLKWNASKVGDFEAGRSAPTFATVLTVLLALKAAWNEQQKHGEAPAVDVTLNELVRVRGGFIALNDAVDIAGRELAAVCAGDVPVIEPRRIRKKGTRAPRPHNWDRRMEDISALLQQSGLTEDRLARRLAISHTKLAGVSLDLWQKTFSEERDQRAGVGANQQKKGQISRKLRAELEKKLTDGK
jgi:transcriptional regulator with XRE-family HTH domain